MPDPYNTARGTHKSPGRPGDAPAAVGRYQVQSVLGTGSFGRVYLAYDPNAHRHVAVKQPFGAGLDPTYWPDFLKEARAVAAIDQHANICPVYDVDTDSGGVPYIVMRFVAGGTLKRMLEEHSGALPVRTAVAVARKLALGLAAAHAKGIIHRDLKPANVLYDADNHEVLITDFGLARVGADASVLMTIGRGAHGTPYYMPPEQWGSTAFGPITALADVYSLGVILYEMLTGGPPYVGGQLELMAQHCSPAPPDRPSARAAGVDARLDAIVLRAMATQPAHRFRSAREFADALGGILRGGTSEEMKALPPVAPVAEPGPPLAASTTRPQQTQRHAGGRQPAPAPEPVYDLDDEPHDPRAGSTARPGATLPAKEPVRCPHCEARLKVAANRTEPVACPKCRRSFTVAAGKRAAREAQAEVERQERLAEKRAARRKSPWRRWLRRLAFLSVVLAAAGGAAWVYQDELVEQYRKYRPLPVEFAGPREIVPDADQARVYAFLPGDRPLLVTNSGRADELAVVWDASDGRQVARLKMPADGVERDPEHLRFRFDGRQTVGVFSRHPLPQAKKFGVWAYTLSDDDTETTRQFHPTPRRVWDVNNQLTRAIGEPKDDAVELWDLEWGGGKRAAVEALKADGSKLRAVAFAADGKSVLGLCDQSKLRAWDARTGARRPGEVRLARRPEWGGTGPGEMTLDRDGSRFTLHTGSHIGVWEVDGGAAGPEKKAVDGIPLASGYRLRTETGGRGTFSLFRDNYPLRAAKLTVPGGGEVSSPPVVSEDGKWLATSSGRKVFVWGLTYPPK